MKWINSQKKKTIKIDSRNMADQKAAGSDTPIETLNKQLEID